jgi:hypothetical protein
MKKKLLSKPFFLLKVDDLAIYDANESLKNISEVKDMKMAYDFVPNTYIAIVVIGSYMGLFKGRSAALGRDFLPNMPYWFIIKLRPETTELDRHLLKVIKFI